ncbi:MAG: hypothetical protein GY953_45220, partial [bacterium]|nr:hypothetical protein [bacterium]
MLTIRPEQTEALDTFVKASFESAMADHLSQFAPEISERLDRQAILDLVRLGMKKAAAHGFSNCGPVR